jgi:hypothetical protein
MIQKFSLLILLGFLFFSSCYTITHPEPCPGLTEIESISDYDMVSELHY